MSAVPPEPTDAEIQGVLSSLASGASLSEAEAERLFNALLAGRLDDARIGAILGMLALRTPTIDELTGSARSMRAHVTAVPFEPGPGDRVLDTCGTGGAPKTFNISTAAALVVAAAEGAVRVRVAKHGNRSRSGRGSAEVLAALGVNIDASPEAQARCLAEAGVCFCFAIHHHPAARHAASVRRALGFPTLFNILGPLTNPAGARHQLLGIYRRDFVPLMAHALARLGAKRAMVVHGCDGLDEITITGPTYVAMVDGGAVREDELDPAALGVGRGSLESLRADDLDQAADAIRGVLAGERGPRRDVVEINSAAALLVAGAAADLSQGLELAREAIDSGRARDTLATLARVSTAGSV